MRRSKEEKKHLTVLVVPQDAGKVRRLRLSARMSKILLAVLVVFMLGWAVMLLDYLGTKFDNVHLRRQNESLRVSNAKFYEKDLQNRLQVETLQTKMNKVEKKIARITEMDENLRNMAHLVEENGEAVSVGGPTLEQRLDARSVKMEPVDYGKINNSLDRMLTEVATREHSFEQLQEYFEEERSLFVSTPSIWPVRGWVSSEFGPRISPFTGKLGMHEGIDIATQLNREIYAPAIGIVEFVGVKGGYGNTLVLRHGRGISTLYGHLSSILVRRGQKVLRGSVIALVGNTGRSTGPHLHYEVRVNGVPVNPRRFILN